MTGNTDPRFLEKVERTATCWEWHGASNGRSGRLYGRFTVDSKAAMAHRYAYEQFVGPIPEGFQIDHLCKNTLCVNPGHLEAVTPEENNRRSTSPTSLNMRKTYCDSGHEFTPENTYIRKNGSRACRTCRRLWNRKRYAARALASASAGVEQ